MNPYRKQRPSHSATRCLSMALALLIALSPLLSATQTLAKTCLPDSDPAALSTPPCHSMGDLTSQAPPTTPHCTGDATAAHCPCPAQSVPAGISGPPESVVDNTPSGAPLRDGLTTRLPESPGEGRFRPPIHLLS